MVQLNPLKWGSKKRKEKRNKLRIAEIDESLKKNTRSQGGAGIKRRNLKREKAELDGTAKKEKKTTSERIERDRKRNQRRGTGVKNRKASTTTSTSTSSSSSNKSSKKVGGKKLSNYEMRQAERKAAQSKRAGAKHADWKKMKSGGMSREDFIKKYPRSQTARKYGKK